mmetsp:Transcript_29057/g.68494  ORF Transcript_29057/g.68494 Transcript_29057/m.68494 type:complete len:144 (+) Transcript_29057:299-730(+)
MYSKADLDVAQAIERGEFDDLPGKGKPFKFERNLNPFGDSLDAWTNKVLKDNNYVPEWAELMQEMDKQLGNATRTLEAAVKSQDRDKLNDQIRAYRAVVEDYNAKVARLETMIPPEVSKAIFRVRINADRMIQRLVDANNEKH